MSSADDVFSEAELGPGSSTFSGSTQKGDAQLSTTVNNVGPQGRKSFVKREEDTELTEKVDVVSKAKVFSFPRKMLFGETHEVVGCECLC